MNPRAQEPPRGVAVVRFGAAGDVVLVNPVLTALGAAWPEAELTVVTHGRYGPLVVRHPRVTRVVAYDPAAGLRPLAAELRALGVTALCDLHGSWRSRALAAWVRPERRVVWHKRSLVERLAVTVGHGRYRPEVPMERRYHRAAEQLVGRPLPRPALAITPAYENVAAAQALIQGHSALLGRRLVVLLPGAAWATKRWPIGHFVALAKRLLAAGLAVAAVGDEPERPLTRALAQGAPGTGDLGGRVPLGLLLGLLAQAAAAVAGDTGPMHMARALGTPTVALFGSTPATQFLLEGQGALTPEDVHCSPCSFYGRPACPRGHLRCMTEISVDAVWQKLTERLNQPTQAG